MRDSIPDAEQENATLVSRLASLDWRTWFGLVLTFSWLLLGYFYIRITVGWNAFTVLPADELGNFLEGAFAMTILRMMVVYIRALMTVIHGVSVALA